MSSQVAAAPSSTDSKRIYVLKLEQGKYYVGASGDLDSRLQDHRDGHGAKWTQKYSMVELSATSTEIAQWKALEKLVTLKLMRKYGWRNVRGGPWTQRNMSSPPRQLTH